MANTQKKATLPAKRAYPIVKSQTLNQQMRFPGNYDMRAGIGNANSTRQRYMPSSDGAMMIGRKRGRPSNAKASFRKAKGYSEADMGSMAAYGKTLKGLKNYTGK